MSRQQDWQWQKLKYGLCRQCGKNPVASSILCEACLIIFRERINRQRAKARAFRKGSPKKKRNLELSVC